LLAALPLKNSTKLIRILKLTIATTIAKKALKKNSQGFFLTMFLKTIQRSLILLDFFCLMIEGVKTAA